MLMVSRLLLVLLLTPFLALSQKSDSTKRTSIRVYPAFGYQPNTSLQFGIIAVGVLRSEDESQSEFKRQSSITPFAIYTLKKQVLTETNVDYFFKNGSNLNISPRFFNFPDAYFGIGNDTDLDISESYTNRYWRLEGFYLKPFGLKTFIGINFDLHGTDLRDIIPDGLLESSKVEGLEGGTIVGFGPTLKYDARNQVIYPTGGHLFTLQSTFNYVGDFSFTNFRIDARKYHSIINEKNVLAIQINSNLSTGSVPFYRLPQLGGSSRLRGIENSSLYRDNQSVFTQIEYRRHLFWRVGLVAFAGAGNVAANLRDFELGSMKYVAGVGYRFAVIPNQKLNVRFDFGISGNGQNGFYVGMREAF